jgi:hypothetical protein
MRGRLTLLFLLSPLFCLANQQTHKAEITIMQVMKAGTV